MDNRAEVAALEAAFAAWAATLNLEQGGRVRVERGQPTMTRVSDDADVGHWVLSIDVTVREAP